jgi:hypothetical protein
VVLASAYYAYIGPERHLVDAGTEPPVDVAPGTRIALERLAQTVRQVRALGKRVVVMAPVPSTGFDYTHCIERRARGRTWSRRRLDCDIPRDQYDAHGAATRDLLDRLARQEHVCVVRVHDVLCDAHRCRTSIAGVMLYRDEGHLSVDGAGQVGRTAHLVARLEAAAR